MRTWGVFVFYVFVLNFTFSAFAETPKSKLKVFFDCTLTTNVSCMDLGPDFFIKDPSLQQVSSPKEADVIVKVWALSSASNPTEQYKIEYIGQKELPSHQIPDSFLQLPQSMPTLQKLFTLLNQLAFGIAYYHPNIDDVKISPDGKAIVYTVLISNATNSNNNTQNPESPFSLSLGISGNVTGNESLLQVTTGGGLKLSYDTIPIFVRVGGGGAYKYLMFNTGTDVLTGSNFSGGAGIDVITQSPSPHWNILVRLQGGHDPSSNVDFRGQAQAGIEYETNPRLNTSTNAFNVNYIVSDNYDMYHVPNIQQRLQQFFISHALTVFFLRHIVKPNIDLSAAVAVASVVNDPKSFGAGGNVGGTFNFNQSLALNLTFNAGYKQNMVYAPADPNALGPLNPLINTMGPFSRYSYNIVLTFVYTLGNTLLPKQEMRYNFDVSNGSLPLGF